MIAESTIETSAQPAARFKAMLCQPEPVLALAPMQDITDYAFLKVISGFGGADFYVTEYFRVHSASTIQRPFLRCITENPTGQPVIAQLAGRDLEAIARTARELQEYPIAGIDFNLGCPAPIVCRKRAGGALLRELELVDAILGTLREAVTIPLTVKTRVGFDGAGELDELLPVLAKHSLDMVVIHGRTVKQLYRGTADYEAIAKVVRGLPCPVIANGDIDGPQKALNVLRETSAHGLMIGRAAIRNPWLFAQTRQAMRGEPLHYPSGREVAEYLRQLYVETTPAFLGPRDQIDKFKKYLNFIGPGLPCAAEFLYEGRRMATREDLDALLAKYLNHDESLTLVAGASVEAANKSITFEKGWR